MTTNNNSITDFANLIRILAEQSDMPIQEVERCFTCRRDFLTSDDGQLVRHYRGFCAERVINPLIYMAREHCVGCSDINCSDGKQRQLAEILNEKKKGT